MSRAWLKHYVTLPNGELIHRRKYYWELAKLILALAFCLAFIVKTLWLSSTFFANDEQILYKGNKSMFEDAKHLFGNTKHLFGDAKHLFGATKHLFGDAKHLFGDTKHLFGATKHLFGGTKHLFGGPNTSLETPNSSLKRLKPLKTLNFTLLT